MRSRIMYIEDKSGGLTGPARIGRVSFSKTGATLSYRGLAFRSLKGDDYYEVTTGASYWISGPRRDGADALYATHTQPIIDSDVHDEYWREIRGQRSVQVAQNSDVSGPLPR